MAELLLIIVIVLVAVAFIAFMVNRSRAGLKADSPYIRGQSIIYDKVYGLCYVKGIERRGESVPITYTLITALEGEVTKDFEEAQLLEPNKHLNIVGRSFIITSEVVNFLSGKVDVVALEDNLKSVKEDLASLQSKYNYEVANRDALVNDAFERAGTLLSKMPKGRPK